MSRVKYDTIKSYAENAIPLFMLVYMGRSMGEKGYCIGKHSCYVWRLFDNY